MKEVFENYSVKKLLKCFKGNSNCHRCDQSRLQNQEKRRPNWRISGHIQARARIN